MHFLVQLYVGYLGLSFGVIGYEIYKTRRNKKEKEKECDATANIEIQRTKDIPLIQKTLDKYIINDLLSIIIQYFDNGDCNSCFICHNISKCNLPFWWFIDHQKVITDLLNIKFQKCLMRHSSYKHKIVGYVDHIKYENQVILYVKTEKRIKMKKLDSSDSESDEEFLNDWDNFLEVCFQGKWYPSTQDFFLNSIDFHSIHL